MKKIAVIVPIYKNKLSSLEEFSLDFSLQKIGKNSIFFIGPEKIDLQYYKEKYEKIFFIPFDSNFFTSIADYNRLLLTKEFYLEFKNFEFLLVLQTDAIVIRNEIDYWCSQPFDYIGAPWPDQFDLKIHLDAGRFSGLFSKKIKPKVGNGGLSLRRIKKCINLLEEFPEISNIFIENKNNEDLYFSSMAMLSKSFLVPNEIVASFFSMELSPNYFFKLNGGHFPMGGHAWWKYEPDFWLPLFEEESNFAKKLIFLNSSLARKDTESRKKPNIEKLRELKKNKNSYFRDQKKIKFLQVQNFYPAALDILYEKIPDLKNKSYINQCDEIINDGFCSVHMIAPYLSELGYDSKFVIANNLYAQIQWLKENQKLEIGSKISILDIVKAQIEEIKPDVLYLTDPITFDGKFIAQLNYRPQLIIGWRAAVIPVGMNWKGFDIMLSLLDGLLEKAIDFGAKKGIRFHPGFPTWIYEKIKHIDPIYDVVFCGQLSSKQHVYRNSLLQRVAEESLKGEFSCAFYLSGDSSLLTPEMKRVHKSSKYGLEMHQALRKGRIAIDARASHGMIDRLGNIVDDFGRNQTANMRIFEATGSGCMLLTEHFENLSDFFEIGTEIETFRSENELIEKIKYFTSHPTERDLIANRGHNKCMLDHSMSARSLTFDKLIKNELQNC